MRAVFPVTWFAQLCLKLSPGSALWHVSWVRGCNVILLSCLRSQEQSSPAFLFLPLATKSAVWLQSWLPPVISPCWRTAALKCFLKYALTTTASSSSVRPGCHLPFQGQTFCSVCGAQAKHLGRESTQVCYETQQSHRARRPDRQILV